MIRKRFSAKIWIDMEHLGIDHLHKNSAERSEKRSRPQGQLAGPTGLKFVLVVIIIPN
jgi:hypothetical protein